MELLRKLDVMAKHTEYAKTGRKRGFYALFSYSKFLLFPISAKIRKNNLDLSNASLSLTKTWLATNFESAGKCS